jgi:NAD(P)-dependent dehydrogenase (short-subunit alcohol dehydrogenase family)
MSGVDRTENEGAGMNKMDLEGRLAAITGGAAGIGLAIAQRMAESGARVALWDRDQAAAEAALPSLAGSGHLAVALDVSNESDVAAAARKTIDAFGAIDIMVCSAGITGPNKTVADYGFDDWRQVFDVNMHGVFLCNRVVLPSMMERDYGRIVNIASIAGKEGNPNASAYSASKAAVIGLTKSLGKELARTGIRVNCITPAAVKTAIFDQMTQQHIDFMLSKIPMSRFGKVEEIAAMVCWLASEECSFSTGAVFDISGGRAVY